MITHLLFKGLNSFNIGSIMFRKILAVIIAVLIFSLVFLAVKFTKVEVPNFNRNLIMLAIVDISAFGLVIWKFASPCEKEGTNSNDRVEEKETQETQETKETKETNEDVSNKEKMEKDNLELQKDSENKQDEKEES